MSPEAKIAFMQSCLVVPHQLPQCWIGYMELDAMSLSIWRGGENRRSSCQKLAPLI